MKFFHRYRFVCQFAGAVITFVAAIAAIKGCSGDTPGTATRETVQPVLSGSAGPGDPQRPVPARDGKADAGNIDTIPFADAYCRRDERVALAATEALHARFPANPRVQLVHAFALELAGNGPAAYRLFEALANADHRMPVALRCGGSYVYSGGVSEVAQRRLFTVKSRLDALNVRFPLPAESNDAVARERIRQLAALATATAKAPPVPHATETAMAQAAPAASEPLAMTDQVPGHSTGQMTGPMPAKPQMKQAAAPEKPREPKPGGVFVHLGSYRSMKMLDRGWKELRERHAGLLKDREKAVTHVDLGRKGRYLRLGVKADDRASATLLCRRLKAARQYCEVRHAGRS